MGFIQVPAIAAVSQYFRRRRRRPGLRHLGGPPCAAASSCPSSSPSCSTAPLGALVGPPLDGVFGDHYGGFFEASMFSGALCLVGAALAFSTKATME